ncbi:MAG TPA: tetratricopeptide repeat protein, partial [Pyrinomonadaceae bacterium]|nr:tetratricopeptide repeat protein [Pyrinomonadaceae bacterium]
NDQTLYAFQAGAILEAQHKQPAAIIEYAKALDDNADDYQRAKRRLVTLYKRAGVPAQLRQAVAQAQASARATSAHNDSSLVLGYVSLLQAVGQQQAASALLRQGIANSHDQDFLDSAHTIFSEAEDTGGERVVLRQLTQVASGPHSRISYRLQLAESYASTGETDAAAAVLNELLAQYPTNYGVLNEAASFYWRLGRRDAALNVLRVSMTRGRGRFHYLFARKLAARELELNHSAEAVRVLLALHNEDKANTDVFHELMRLYVHDGRRAQLQQIFRETLAALKAQNLGNRDLQAQVAEFRTQLIDAFTRLKDYRAAVEQHIEIINRDPEDEANLNAALAYVKRYGGGDTLLAYYQKTAQAAYKNYRWNVVLARIYEAKGDYASAAANYRA